MRFSADAPRADLLSSKIDEKILEHALGMVATWRRLDHRRDPVCIETGEENRALDLGAGHWRADR